MTSLVSQIFIALLATISMHVSHCVVALCGAKGQALYRGLLSDKSQEVDHARLWDELNCMQELVSLNPMTPPLVWAQDWSQYTSIVLCGRNYSEHEGVHYEAVRWSLWSLHKWNTMPSSTVPAIPYPEGLDLMDVLKAKRSFSHLQRSLLVFYC